VHLLYISGKNLQFWGNEAQFGHVSTDESNLKIFLTKFDRVIEIFGARHFYEVYFKSARSSSGGKIGYKI